MALAAVGLSINSITGLISGTPTGVFSSTIVLAATNAQGTGTSPLSITITEAAVTSGRWNQAVGYFTVYRAYTATLSAIVEDSTPSVLTFSLVMESGAFPPGVTWQLYNPNGDLLHTLTSEGGEYTMSASVDINLGGGYISYVSTSSATVRVRGTISIASGAQFSNSSLWASVITPSISGDLSSQEIQLLINDITSTSRISTVDFSGVTDGQPDGALTPPNYSWNFGGDTANNPKTNFASGLTNLVLIGRGQPLSAAGVVIGCNG